MRILFLGDIVGRTGRETVAAVLPGLHPTNMQILRQDGASVRCGDVSNYESVSA